MDINYLSRLNEIQFANAVDHPLYAVGAGSDNELIHSQMRGPNSDSFSRDLDSVNSADDLLDDAMQQQIRRSATGSKNCSPCNTQKKKCALS